jgi:hypothetical protein
MPLGSLTVAAIHENVSFCDFTIVNLSGVATDAIYNFMAARITGNVAPPDYATFGDDAGAIQL